MVVRVDLHIKAGRSVDVWFCSHRFHSVRLYSKRSGGRSWEEGVDGTSYTDANTNDDEKESETRWPQHRYRENKHTKDTHHLLGGHLIS
jgi:hypothetical protein